MTPGAMPYGDPTLAAVRRNDHEGNVVSFGSLRVDEAERIVLWLVEHFEPSPGHYWLGSYRLKHVAQRAGLSYTTNGEFSAMLLIAGFDLVRPPAYPWSTYFAHLRPKPESRIYIERLEVAAGYRSSR